HRRLGSPGHLREPREAPLLERRRRQDYALAGTATAFRPPHEPAVIGGIVRGDAHTRSGPARRAVAGARRLERLHRPPPTRTAQTRREARAIGELVRVRHVAAYPLRTRVS